MAKDYMDTLRECDECRALLQEALDYEKAAWEAIPDEDGEIDEDVNGGDLVEWFGEWRERVKAAIHA